MAYILLGADNKVLQESIQHKMEAEKKEPCDAKLFDFDDVNYRIFVDPDKRDKMLVELTSPSWEAVKDAGSEDYVKSKLGDFVTTVSNEGVNFEIDLSDEKCMETAESVGEAFSKLRIYALGGPLFRYLKAMEDKKDLTDTFDFAFRKDTHMWIVPGKKKVTSVFAFEFPNKSDRIIATQILKEFQEVRRKREFGGTPNVLFTKTPPEDLKSCKMPSFNDEHLLGFFSISIGEVNIRGGKLEQALENVIGFRAYLTYHIKCAKAFFHSRMRLQVKTMLKVLNRARYEPDDSRKKKKVIVGTDRRRKK